MGQLGHGVRSAEYALQHHMEYFSSFFFQQMRGFFFQVAGSVVQCFVDYTDILHAHVCTHVLTEVAGHTKSARGGCSGSMHPPGRC